MVDFSPWWVPTAFWVSPVTQSQTFIATTEKSFHTKADIQRTTNLSLQTLTFRTTASYTTPVPQQIQRNITVSPHITSVFDIIQLFQKEEWTYFTLLSILLLILCGFGCYHVITTLLSCKVFCLSNHTRLRSKPVSVQPSSLPTPSAIPLLQDSTAPLRESIVTIHSPPTLPLRPVLPVKLAKSRAWTSDTISSPHIDWNGSHLYDHPQSITVQRRKPLLQLSRKVTFAPSLDLLSLPSTPSPIQSGETEFQFSSTEGFPLPPSTEDIQLSHSSIPGYWQMI